MRIEILGPLAVRGDDGAPVAVPGAKERLLLAVLAAGAPAVVSADRIADALWDGAPPATARRSLQVHVVHLRSALEPERPRGSSGLVLGHGCGYRLGVRRADLDALAFADLVSQGRSRLAVGGEADAARDLGEALRLWRGEPYADWPQAAFAVPERCRLGELRATAVSGRIEARLALGEAVDVVAELEEHVAEAPLREDWWRLLMLARYRTGRQADALAAGRRARAVLAAELGCAPGPALRAMEAAILAQDPALDPPRRVVAVLARPAAPVVVRPAPGPAAAPLPRGPDRRVRDRREPANAAARGEREAVARRRQRQVVVSIVVLVVALVLALVAAVVATVVAVRVVP
jgi:DNA-binding SARP family transcriptional activator